jgi:hypothetical protein
LDSQVVSLDPIHFYYLAQSSLQQD